MSADEEVEVYKPPPYQATTWGLLGSAAILVVVLMTVRLGQNPDTPRPGDLAPMPEDGALVLMDEPEMDDEYWPCSDCHDGEPTNFTVREMDDEHDEMPFDHGTTWCMDCHDVDDRDKLTLAGGTLVDFDETHELCGQCHGSKIGDWKSGVHGKRLGHWVGDAQYKPCVSCHNPHSPAFEGLEPKPPPLRPEQIVLPGAVAEAEEPAEEAPATEEGGDHE